MRLETPAPGRRRIDVETGATVIECKKDLSVGAVRADAIEQLAGYVEDRSNELGHRYAGVLTDGQEWTLFHLNQASGELHPVSSLRITPGDPDVDGLLVWLEGVLSTGEQIVPTPLEVQRRLGSTAPGFELDLAELRDVYEQCRSQPDVRQKRELWSRLLAAAFGRTFTDDDELFIEHTYLVLTAEVIAHAVVGFELRTATISAQDLVTGEEFRRASIAGVVEADFFDWPIDTPQGVAFVDGLARRLARFAWEDVRHDVLKVLYESVIDPETRHSLGEYYTPDWLAELMVTEVVDDPLRQRVLDPACGSGTFVFWAVRRYLAAADAADQSNRDAINGALSHVSGIDLHPVAVTLARVTYLLALGSDRLQDRGPLTIPVYLGDSIQFNDSTSVVSPGGLTILTHDGLELVPSELNFPESLIAHATRFDRLIDELASKASERLASGDPPAIGQLMTNYGVTDEADREMVEESYRTLCHLHDFQRDHIWGYYIRNLARPLEFSRPEHRVDRLVGNPPWLRYNAMPSETRDHFRRLTADRNLQAPAQVVTSQDLSALFVARSVELYLRSGGNFGFVMPAAALSRLQYRGFRAANYSSQAATAYVAFDQPWELSEVRPKPFPVPASVVLGRRVEAGDLAAMPTSEVREIVVASEEFDSPYASLVRQGSNLVPRVLVVVRERDPGPLGVPADQVPIKSARLGNERMPWKDLPDLEGAVEHQFVMPILLGASVLPFRLRDDIRAVLPWDGTKLLSGSSDEIDAYAGLADWWRNAEQLFERHKSDTTAMDLVGWVDYQGKLSGQFPVKEHRIAYTGRGEVVTAARISTQDAIVDHALYWVALDSAEEALYVIGVINTEALQSRIADALSRGLFGGRNIHRAPFLVPWPQFDPAESLHRDIARTALEAEGVAQSVEQVSGGIAAARNRVRAQLREHGATEKLEALVEDLLVTAHADDQIQSASVT